MASVLCSHAGHKKLRNRPVPRGSVYETAVSDRYLTCRQVARVVLEDLYTEDRLWHRVSELERRRKIIAELKGFSMERRSVIPLHQGITVFNGVTGVLVAELYIGMAPYIGNDYMYSYHELYEEVRWRLRVSESISVALVFRSSTNPACIFRPGELIPAHRGRCMAGLRGSILDTVLHH